MSTAVLPTTVEMARVIAAALADDRVRRHHEDLPEPSLEEERELARSVAASILARRRTGGEWGFDVLPDPAERVLVEESVSAVLGLGRLEPLLADDDISDIHVRGNRPVWVKMRDGRRREHPPIVDSDAELVDLIRRMATRMGHREQRFDPAHPHLNLQLPDGSRIFAAMEVSRRPTLVVRRHRFEYSSLGELCNRGMMAPEVAGFLAAAVRARRNIVVAGGTGSGKTTLLRALINEIPPSERIVTIEDAYELGIENFEDRHPDHDSLQAREANVEGHGEITMADLTRMALRMDPDRVIVGEVRGAEAFPMLLAMSQGNNGSMCTMHADSGRSVFPKLLAYVSMGPTVPPAETITLLVAGAVHLVVHVRTAGTGRIVSSIHEVAGHSGTDVALNEVWSEGADCMPFAALRRPTALLLEEHGFRGREAGWNP